MIVVTATMPMDRVLTAMEVAETLVDATTAAPSAMPALLVVAVAQTTAVALAMTESGTIGPATAMLALAMLLPTPVITMPPPAVRPVSPTVMKQSSEIGNISADQFAGTR